MVIENCTSLLFFWIPLWRFWRTLPADHRFAWQGIAYDFERYLQSPNQLH